jgi:hypothetical protein
MFDDNPYLDLRETYQTDYQFKASAVVAEAIHRKGTGLEPGTRYISMPVGSGKTTGAIWGIVRFVKENPGKKVCYLTPFVRGVKEQIEKLKSKLGDAIVGCFYSGASGDKQQQMNKDVFVCTHQFGSYNLSKLKDRDLIVVDEAIYGSDDVQVSSQIFYESSEWARRQNILKKEFRAVFEFLDGVVQKPFSGNGFVPIDHSSIKLELKKIVAYDFSDLVNPFSDNARIVDTQNFCGAMLDGKAFSAYRENGNVTFVSGALGIPSVDNAIILTATGGMTYDAVGSFSEVPLVKTVFKKPRYDQLTLVRLSDPEITGSYKTWKGQKTKESVEAYVSWVLEQVTEDEIYFCVPKSVFDGCLKVYFGFTSTGTVELPKTVTKGGKTIHLSHHHIGIGSNNYKNCKAVVYLWDSHIPKLATIRKYHVLSGDSVTTGSLEDANNGDLRGAFSKVRDASLVENVIQQIGRGQIRQIDQHGQANEMKAYVLLKPKTFSQLQMQMTGSKLVDCGGYGKIRKPSGRVQKILEYLRQNSGKSWAGEEVKAATTTNVTRIKGELKEMEDELLIIGYKFEKGTKGRGNGSKFIWVGIAEDVSYKKTEVAA